MIIQMILYVHLNVEHSEKHPVQHVLMYQLNLDPLVQPSGVLFFGPSMVIRRLVAE